MQPSCHAVIECVMSVVFDYTMKTGLVRFAARKLAVFCERFGVKSCIRKRRELPVSFSK